MIAFKSTTVSKDTWAENAIHIILSKEEKQYQCCDSVNTSLRKIRGKIWANSHMLAAPCLRLLELC